MPTSDASTDEIIKRFLKAVKEARKQDPSGVAIKHDGDAPRLVQFGGYQRPACCTPGDPSGDPSEKKFLEDLGPSGAIRVFFSVGFMGNGKAAIKDISAHSLKPDGDFLLQPSGRWQPDAATQKWSLKGSIGHAFSICVPCGSFLRSPNASPSARFVVIAEDAAGNASIQVLGVVVGQDQFDGCCAG